MEGLGHSRTGSIRPRAWSVRLRGAATDWFLATDEGRGLTGGNGDARWCNVAVELHDVVVMAVGDGASRGPGSVRAWSGRRVFLSYRREETRHIAGRIADRIGPDRVFMDVDSIEPGVDFGVAIAGAVESCEVLVAVIGQEWLTSADHRGRRRLDDPDDFVVLEIGTALRRSIRVIPVLVDGAYMPRRDELPPALESLARRNAVRIDHESFSADIGRLLAGLETSQRDVDADAIAADPAPRSSTPSPSTSPPDPGSPARVETARYAEDRAETTEPFDVTGKARTTAPPPPHIVPDDQRTPVSPDGPWRDQVAATRAFTDAPTVLSADDLQSEAPMTPAELASGVPTEIVRLVHDGADIVFLEFSPDGTQLATFNRDDTVRVWDSVTGRELIRFNQQMQMISGVVYGLMAFNPDGTQLAVASGRAVRVWDPAAGRELATLKHKKWINWFAYSPDGSCLATASGGTGRVWDSVSGEEMARVTEGGEVLTLTFSPDGTQLATANTTGVARLWDPTTGHQRGDLATRGSVWGIWFTADGVQLVTVGAQTARVWDLASGREVAKMTHEKMVSLAELSPDGTRMVTADYVGERRRGPGTARVWDLATGRQLAHPTHEQRVTSVAFSPDSTVVATASEDGEVGIWEAATGGELASLSHDGKVSCAEFCPNGTRLATACAGTVRVWALGKE